jgi:hypothetical protein
VRANARRSWRWGLIVLFCVLVGGAVSVGATEDDLAELPVTQPHRCLTCHAVAAPLPSNAELNSFGEDFLDNGRRWNARLAELDSDLDGCLNGVEIGDADGDGHADGNVDEQSGNPGVPDDCAAGLTDERTWSALKALFDEGR